MAVESVHEVEWREIPGCPGYRAGSNGEIQSSLWPGKRLSQRAERPWKSIVARRNDKNGYMYVTMRVNCKHYTATVHSLILRAFIGERPNGMDACHTNGCRTDNRIQNLRWDTRKNNNLEKSSHGTQVHGEQHPVSKLTDEIVMQMRQMRVAGMSFQKIANRVGVNLNTAWNAVTGRTWKHLEAFQQ